MSKCFHVRPENESNFDRHMENLARALIKVAASKTVRLSVRSIAIALGIKETRLAGILRALDETDNIKHLIATDRRRRINESRQRKSD